MPIFFDFFPGFANDHTQDALNDAFVTIGTDFLKLSTADTTADFLKLETDHKVTVTFDVIGDAFAKLGQDLKIDTAAVGLDSFVVKFFPPNPIAPPNPTSEAADGGAPDPQSDFLKVDAALKASSSDLAALAFDWQKLDTAPNQDIWKVDVQAVGVDFQKLSSDASDAGGAFKLLGGDLATLGTGENSGSTELNDALKILGGELKIVVSAFEAIASDWQALKTDIASFGGGVTTTSATSPNAPPAGPLGADFQTLDKDFLLLNQALGATAPGTFKLLDALFDQNGVNEHKIDQVEHLLGGHGGSERGHG